jgi:hypothetical protein
MKWPLTKCKRMNENCVKMSPKEVSHVRIKLAQNGSPTICMMISPIKASEEELRSMEFV